MDTNYIKSLLTMFKNKNVYEIETAILIYEFMDSDLQTITDTDINKVYKLVKSYDEIFSDSIKEDIQHEVEEQEKREESKENKIDMTKEDNGVTI